MLGYTAIVKMGVKFRTYSKRGQLRLCFQVELGLAARLDFVLDCAVAQ